MLPSEAVPTFSRSASTHLHHMKPIGKALWFIETHFAQDISLEAIANVAGVSRYHLVRAFGRSTGLSVMRYVRSRRLSEAARSLASGAPDILAVALDAGYNSHEAFTRAFHDRFGITPVALRARRRLDCVGLVDAIKLDERPIDNLAPPRFENYRALRVVGLRERFDHERSAGIPALWQRFHPYYTSIPGQIGAIAYGACSILRRRRPF